MVEFKIRCNGIAPGLSEFGLRAAFGAASSGDGCVRDALFLDA